MRRKEKKKKKNLSQTKLSYIHQPLSLSKALTTLGSQVPDQHKPAVGVLHPRTFSCCGAPIMPNLVLLTVTFILGGGWGGDTQIHMTWNIILKMRFNSYSGTITEYSSYNFLNKFGEWSTNALIQHLVGSEGILPLVWEDFFFLNRFSIDQIKSLLCKSHAGHYEPPSHDAISFPLFLLTKLFLLSRVV